MACDVTSTDAPSQTTKAGRLIPAEQCTLTKCQICGTYAAPAKAAPMNPAIVVTVDIDRSPLPHASGPAPNSTGIQSG
jgi:hypothetical protein